MTFTINDLVQAPASPIANVRTLVVDYNDTDGLASVLKNNSIEIIISVIQVNNAESAAAEHNLVRAASKSASTKRFIASNWGFPIPSEEK